MAWMDNTPAGAAREGSVGSYDRFQFAHQPSHSYGIGGAAVAQYGIGETSDENHKDGVVKRAVQHYKKWMSEQSSATKRSIAYVIAFALVVAIGGLVVAIVKIRKRIFDRHYESQKEAIVAKTLKENGASPTIAKDVPASSFERYIIQTMQQVKDKLREITASDNARSIDTNNSDIDYAIGMLNAVSNMAHDDLIFQLTAVRVVEMRNKLNALKVKTPVPNITSAAPSTASLKSPALKSAMKSNVTSNGSPSPSSSSSNSAVGDPKAPGRPSVRIDESRNTARIFDKPVARGSTRASLHSYKSAPVFQ